MQNLSNIPSTPHYAIITEVSVSTPGDERSRTNPGHGYPASTETYICYESFIDQNEWEFKIQRLSTNNTRFKAMKVDPVKITPSVKIEFS